MRPWFEKLNKGAGRRGLRPHQDRARHPRSLSHRLGRPALHVREFQRHAAADAAVADHEAGGVHRLGTACRIRPQGRAASSARDTHDEYQATVDYAKAQDRLGAARDRANRRPGGGIAMQTELAPTRTKEEHHGKAAHQLRPAGEDGRRDAGGNAPLRARGNAAAGKLGDPRACAGLLLVLRQFLERHLPQRRARSRHQGAVPAVRVALGRCASIAAISAR